MSVKSFDLTSGYDGITLGQIKKIGPTLAIADVTTDDLEILVDELTLAVSELDDLEKILVDELTLAVSELTDIIL